MSQEQPNELMKKASERLAKHAKDGLKMSATEAVRIAEQLAAMNCPECGTDPLTPHKMTCSRSPQDTLKNLSDVLRASVRLSRVVNEQIGAMVTIGHPLNRGVPDEQVIRLAKRRLYKQARRPQPGMNGRIYRPWGKPAIHLSRDVDPLSNNIQVSAKWNKAVDLTRPDPYKNLIPSSSPHLPKAPYPQTVCSCAPCRDWHGEPDSKGGCFVGETGHGKCVDTFDQECVCSGTAADGECEGCWLWLK